MAMEQQTAPYNPSHAEPDTDVNPARNTPSALEKPLRACINCVRAKAKCSPIIVMSGKCERCHRMNKHCQPSPPMRKRRKASRMPRNRVDHIEEKLDGLVVLLKSATQGPPGPSNSSSLSATDEPISSGAGTISSSLTANNAIYHATELSRNGTHTPATSSSGTDSVNPHLTLSDPSLSLTSEQAETRLKMFRDKHLLHLPFFVLSPSITAQELHQQKPLLWLSIVTVTSTRSTEQIALSNELRAIFGQKAFVEGARTMDFLLAVLVCTTWDKRHCMDKPISTGLVQLAITIVYDLGLDKPPSQDPGLLLPYDLKGRARPPRFSRSATLEERRALLGCFIVSIFPSFLGKGESLRWTTYYDRCLRVLEEQKECPSDLLLAQLVKSRQIIDNVMDHPWPSDVEGGDSTYLHGPVYLKSLQAQLQNFQQNIPPELTNNKNLLLEIDNVKLLIHSIGFSQAPHVFPGQSKQRFECVYACLQATKSSLDIFFTIPLTEYMGFSELTYSSMIRCFVGLYRLAACAHPEWDPKLLHETIDVSWVLDETQRKFSEAAAAAGLDLDRSQGQDYFSVIKMKLQYMRTWWDAMVGSTLSAFTAAALDGSMDLSSEFLDLWNW